MWNCTGTSISMARGDFGIKLPITVSGVTFNQYDELRLKIVQGGAEVLSLTFSNIQQSTVQLELTEAQTALLPVGEYQYSLDWYQNSVFMCNVIPFSSFRVVDKA